MKTQAKTLNKTMSAEIKRIIAEAIGIGEDNAKNNRELRAILEARGHKVSESELRKHIEELRESPLSSNILLANTTDGYFYDSNQKQVIAYMESLQSRIVQIAQTLSFTRRNFERKYSRSASLFLDPASIRESIKSLEFSAQGSGIYWHPSAKMYLMYVDGRLGRVKSIYDKNFSVEFFSIEELKSYLSAVQK